MMVMQRLLEGEGVGRGLSSGIDAAYVDAIRSLSRRWARSSPTVRVLKRGRHLTHRHLD